MTPGHLLVLCNLPRLAISETITQVRMGEMEGISVSPKTSAASPASLFLSSLELNDTKVYEPQIRALHGSASRSCEVASPASGGRAPLGRCGCDFVKSLRPFFTGLCPQNSNQSRCFQKGALQHQLNLPVEGDSGGESNAQKQMPRTSTYFWSHKTDQNPLRPTPLRSRRVGPDAGRGTDAI